MNAAQMTEEQRLAARKDRLKSVLKLNGVPLDKLTKQALDTLLEEQSSKKT